MRSVAQERVSRSPPEGERVAREARLRLNLSGERTGPEDERRRARTAQRDELPPVYLSQLRQLAGTSFLPVSLDAQDAPSISFLPVQRA